ncbi:MAG TPA: DUF882 domain-containing protein [Microvirga sp.]|nr:DUF882 domain-containing protein [Microvirga sp.]
MGSAPNVRRRVARNLSLRLGFCSAAIATSLLVTPAGTQDASALGETRTISFFHTHTRESATITYRRNGRYDEQALEQLNWLLRDWRVNKPAKMDPRLFDILWEIQQEAGSREPFHVISAYRSPETNGMLRRRSNGVSEHSQHMLGKAMDVRLPDVDTGRLRAIAMKLQYGGVGYYPSSQFVHVDVGNVRAWPRMSQEQLARLFPDGKTLHLPASGRPLSGYEQARAEILSRNAAFAAQASAGGGSVGSLFATLFGRKAAPPAQAERPAEPAHTQVASASPEVAVPEPVDRALALAPIPPRRPQELLLASAPEAPEPAVALAPAYVTAAATEPVLGFDREAAVRAIFEPHPAAANVGFSPSLQTELSATAFTGPAVKPLPLVQQVVRQAQLDF